MLKYLLVVGVVAFIYFFFIKNKPLKDTPKKQSDKLEGNDMVECPKCGVYCEVDDSILSNGKYYCSSECAKDS